MDHHCDERSNSPVRTGRGGRTSRAVMAGLLGIALTVPGFLTARAAESHHPSAAPTAKCVKRNPSVGTVRFSDWIFPDTLNLFQTNTSVSLTVINALQDSIFQYDGRARLIPEMAAVIPTLKNGLIKNGGKSITIRLRKGMRWSNNKEITSADVKFGWRIGMDAATGPWCSGSCDAISSIATPDRYTAVLHLKQVYAPAIPNAMPPVFPTSWSGAWTNDSHAAALKLGQDPAFNFEGPSFPTDGAYQVTSFVRDDRVVLRPMKYYNTLICGARVKNLIFSGYATKATMIAAAAAKQTDVSDDYLLVDIPELRKHTDAYTLSVLPSFSFDHFEFNVDSTYNGKPNPLANTKVRQALALALDKLGLLRSALGLSASVAKQVVAWTFLVNTPQLVQPFADKKIDGQWDPIAKQYVIPGNGKALTDARTLLSQTPYKGGFSLDFVAASGNPTRAAEIDVASKNWARLGVKVTPVLVPPTKLLAGWDQGGQLDHGLFQATVFGQSGAPDPDGSKYSMEGKYVDRAASSHSSIDQNYAGIHDSIIDAAYSAAARSFDRKVRARNYGAIQARMNQYAYWVPLEYRPSIATSDSKVGSFANNPTTAGVTWNVFNWRAKTG